MSWEAGHFRRSEPPDTDWHKYRNGYVDPSDDFVPTGRWTAYRCVMPSEVYGFDIYLFVIAVNETVGPFRYVRTSRPNRFTACVSIGDRRQGVCIDLGHGRCRSVADAIRQAEKLDVDGAVKSLLNKVYCQPTAYACVWRIENEMPEPFLTQLSINGYGFGSSDLPDGSYIRKWTLNGPWGTTKIRRDFGWISEEGAQSDLKPWGPAALPVVDRIAKGYIPLESAESALLDEVEKWHSYRHGKDIHVFLGMTEQEYGIWVADPGYLSAIIKNRIDSNPS